MSVLLVLEVLAGVFLVLVSSFLAYWVYFKQTHYWVNKNVPFESPVPFLGIYLEFFKGKSLFGIDHELYKKHGRVFGVYAGNKPYLFVGEPELLKHVLVKDFHAFPGRRLFKADIPIIDSMLAVAKGDKWRNIRNTVTPAFTSGKLKSMIPVISDSAQILTNNFMKYAEDGKVVDCRKLFGNFTLDATAIVAFGTRLDSHNDPNNKFVAHGTKMINTGLSISRVFAFVFPKLAKRFGISFFPLETLKFFEDTSNYIIRRREDNKEVRPDFLQMMIDSQKAGERVSEKSVDQSNQAEGAKTNIEKVDQIKRTPLTKDEALSQCILFFLAGNDGTTISLSMMSYHLALHPDVQEKVLEEVDRVWENRTTLDAEAVHEAKYLEAVIDETLRISSPAARLERRAEKDYVLGDTEIPIKKGMIVTIPVYAIHHDPEFFPEPDKFKPERFFPKEESDVKPYTYLPFGAGPRNCVAMRLALMEFKIVMLHVLRSVKFSACPETRIPMKYMKRSEFLLPKDVILNVTLRS